MEGIDNKIISHKLNIDLVYNPVKQKHNIGPGKRKFGEEVNKLLATTFIREVQYPKWLAGMVLVKKLMANSECVDCNELNKACPKHYFPLP